MGGAQALLAEIVVGECAGKPYRPTGDDPRAGAGQRFGDSPVQDVLEQGQHLATQSDALELRVAPPLRYFQ